MGCHYNSRIKWSVANFSGLKWIRPARSRPRNLQGSTAGMEKSTLRPSRPGLVAAILAIQAALLGYSAYVTSPTINEPGHLIAGISYWEFGRFDIYNVNPPLIRLIAAAPRGVLGAKTYSE